MTTCRISTWRHNPGYRPEFLNIREMIEVRNYDGSMIDIGEAGAFIWTYGFGDWNIHEYRILSDDPTQGDGCHSQSEKPSEIVAQSDLKACLRHIKECIGSNELALIISNNEYMIEYRENIYSCKDEVTAVELINTFVKAEKHYVG